MVTRVKKSALGRGLSALISTSIPVSVVEAPELDAEAPVAASLDSGGESHGLVPFAGGRGRVLFLSLDKIHQSPSQPRQHFSEDELRALSESIRAHGVLQPVLVRNVVRNGESRFEIVAGERRWRAAKLAGLDQVPVIIQEMDDREALEVGLVENIQRANLNPIEEAEAYQRLIDEFSLSQADVADRVGKDRASVANFVRLLKLAPEVREFVRSGRLTMGHAKAILTIREPAAQIDLAKRTIDDGLSVRALEEIVGRTVQLDSPKLREKAKRRRGANAAFPELADRLREVLGTKVTVQHLPSGRGKVEVEYFSPEELHRIVDVIAFRE